MKINKDGLHPLYDQYSNEENRLTHALLHTIASSKWLFSRFLKNLVGVNMPLGGETYEISTQKVPFSHGDNNLEEVESVPDAWIIDESSKLGIAVEVKDRKNSLSLSQLRYHANRIKNYKHPHLFVITPDLQRPSKIAELERKEGETLNVVWRSWDEVFRWLAGLPLTKPSKRNKERFLISSLREYLERRREVLGFQGIYFPKGFNVFEAKAILNAEMEELAPTVRKVYKDLVKRGSGITTSSQKSVWDCFGRKEGFTSDLHLTLSIHEDSHDVALTVPNSAGKAWTRLKEVFSEERSQEQLFFILKNLRRGHAQLFIQFHQRHFIGRRLGVTDGYMEFNIDTLGVEFRKKNSKAKEFPVWLPAIRTAILNKKRINGQVQFRAKFFYRETNRIDKPEFVEVAKNTLRDFKPLYDFLRESNGND